MIHCSLGKLSQIRVLGHNAGLTSVALHVGLTSRAPPSFFCHGMKTEHRHWLGQSWLSPHCLAQHEAKLNPHQFRIGGGEGHQNKTTTTKIKNKNKLHFRKLSGLILTGGRAEKGLIKATYWSISQSGESCWGRLWSAQVSALSARPNSLEQCGQWACQIGIPRASFAKFPFWRKLCKMMNNYNALTD